jgi:chemotaxis protein methyltransferase CheR
MKMDLETNIDQSSFREIEIKLLLEGIYLRYHYDFRDYAFSSVERRIASVIGKLKIKTITELLDRILHEPETFATVLEYLTIPTSEMFRDPSYFRALREKVLPVLMTYPSFRIWVAGCSTGEEVYSVAVLLKEEGLLGRAQIYATDINAKSLQRAKDGIYGLEEIRNYSRNYLAAGGRSSLSDYYAADYDAVQMNRDLIKNVVFADHSLATDSSFAEMQLISCRNVLIYFNRELQDRAIELFRDSLCDGCFLGLGSKETMRFSKFAASFEPFIHEERIYRKKRASLESKSSSSL